MFYGKKSINLKAQKKEGIYFPSPTRYSFVT